MCASSVITRGNIFYYGRLKYRGCEQMSFQDLDFADIQQSPEFGELSSMVIEITENDPFTQKLSGTQVAKLRSLVNTVITKATE